MHYEHMKHSGELPLIGVNTFLDEEAPDLGASARSLARHAWCFSVHFCLLAHSLTHSLTRSLTPPPHVVSTRSSHY